MEFPDERFSVSELSRYRKMRNFRNFEEIENLVASNLVSDAEREPEPDFTGKNIDLAVSTIIHDSVIELYRQRSQETPSTSGTLEEIITSPPESFSDKIEAFEEDTGKNRSDIFNMNVYGTPVEEVLEDIDSYYSHARNEEVVNTGIEKYLSNRDFWGRADIIRDLKIDGEILTELRDIKTHYTDTPVPRDTDEYKISAYALISKSDQDIDRFVLEYPVQGIEVEVDPLDWMAHVAQDASEYSELLENSRENQAESLETDFTLDRKGKRAKEFVHGLNIPNHMSYAYATSAASENMRDI